MMIRVVACAVWIAVGAGFPPSLGEPVARATARLRQVGPDFSGTWTAEPPAAASPGRGGAGGPQRGDMGSGWGSTLTLTQTANQLVVESPIFSRYDLQPPVKYVYALDGSETRNKVMLGHRAQTQSSRATWEGSTLKITSTFTFPDVESGKPIAVETVQRLHLESPGSLMIEVTRSGVLGGPGSTTRAAYKKNQ